MRWLRVWSCTIIDGRRGSLRGRAAALTAMLRIPKTLRRPVAVLAVAHLLEKLLIDSRIDAKEDTPERINIQ